MLVTVKIRSSYKAIITSDVKISVVHEAFITFNNNFMLHAWYKMDRSHRSKLKHFRSLDQFNEISIYTFKGRFLERLNSYFIKSKKQWNN